MVKPKSKGNKFELAIYKELKSLDPSFKRSVSSGNTEDEKGALFNDLWMIECKHHKTLTKKQIAKFWGNICEEAFLNDKLPVLLFKENYKKEQVVFVSHLWTGSYTEWRDDCLKWQKLVIKK